MRRYGGGILYATLPLHMQRGCFWILTHDQQVTKAQLYRYTRARPQFRLFYYIILKFLINLYFFYQQRLDLRLIKPTPKMKDQSSNIRIST